MRRYKEDSKVNRLRKVLAVMAVGLAAGLILFSTVTGNNKKARVFVYAGNAADKMGLSEVRIEFIPGYDNPEGESSFQIITGAEGEGFGKIPYGEYTVRRKKNGYYDGYLNIEVKEKEFNIEKWMLPCAEGNSAYILAEWDGEGDIDLCVYDEQNGRCIGAVSTLKDAGNCLYSDENGGNGYESAYIKDVLVGNYTIYVRDSDNIAENHDSSMEQNGVTVSIYTENGLQYQKTAESEETAGLWKCALLYNGEVTEQDEYLYDLTGYAWAERDKHNPDSWAKESDVKVEEVYHYAGEGLDKIIRDEYVKGCCLSSNIEHGTYNADGTMIDGYRHEWTYDEYGNWLLYNDYKYKDGGLCYKIEYQYDEHGNQIQECRYEDGVVTSKYRKEYSYDANGNMLSQYEFNDLESPQTPFLEYEWEYDAAGRIVAENRVEDGLLVYQYASEWSADGRLLRSKSCSYGNGQLEGWDECEYDAAGNLVRNSYYNEWNERGIEEYEYDAAGNRVRCYFYDKENKLKRRGEYEYDANGNRTAESIYAVSGELLIKTEMEYNKDGKKTLSYTHDFGNMAEKEEWEYGVDGKEQSHIISQDSDDDGIYEYRKEEGHNTNGQSSYLYYYEDGVLIRGYRYEYDERGNETAFYSFDDGSWIQEYAYTYAYAYDAAAGMLITDRYEGDFLNKRSVTIYGDT